MRETRRHLDFSEEPFGTYFGRDVRTQDLYRNCTLVAKIARKKHDGHAAFTKGALNSVAASKTGLEALLQIVHDTQYWCAQPLFS